MAMGMVSFSAVLLRTGNPWLSGAAALLTGYLIGLSNGWIIVKLGIPSIVATIGTQFFWRGAVLILTNRSASRSSPSRTRPFIR